MVLLSRAPFLGSVRAAAARGRGRGPVRGGPRAGSGEAADGTLAAAFWAGVTKRGPWGGGCGSRSWKWPRPPEGVTGRCPGAGCAARSVVYGPALFFTPGPAGGGLGARFPTPASWSPGSEPAARPGCDTSAPPALPGPAPYCPPAPSHHPRPLPRPASCWPPVRPVWVCVARAIA